MEVVSAKMDSLLTPQTDNVKNAAISVYVVATSTKMFALNALLMLTLTVLPANARTISMKSELVLVI